MLNLALFYDLNSGSLTTLPLTALIDIFYSGYPYLLVTSQTKIKAKKLCLDISWYKLK